MKSSVHFDVIVVGAGPAGSLCATLLAQAGLKTLLIDKSRFPRDKICGDCINPACWDYFDVMGVSNTLRALGLRVIEAVRVANTTGKEILLTIPSDPAEPFFSMKRSALDDVLRKRAIEEGATFFGETRILDATYNGTWNVLLGGESGIEAYSCNYLVGTDGRNSSVAGKIGAWSENVSSVAGGKRIGLQCHARYLPAVGSEVRLGTLERGYFGVVNVDDHNANIAMVVDADAATNTFRDLLEFVEEVLCGHPMLGREISHSGFIDKVITTFPINPVRRHWNKPQVFLAGDARQTVEPFTGEGVYFALKDGIRTTQEILPFYGLKLDGIVHSRRNYWVNRAFSPILSNYELAEFFFGVVSHFAWFAGMLAGRILGGHSHDGVWRSKMQEAVPLQRR